ncbi:sphingosine-1-phosphate phosphatase 2-like [Schistocerca americana]|uniref:sphingosine-1-phosphate phosphatase 2-like n=1 Tax=Schistocerca americana TaxID=7009 RepID=UPI001F4F777C|nr:sphingosine-1-phosphate phosphatase 2-like [Schistocerca americana]XP_049940159.1 sphingosine-1-phosphate phosphatase 2-like [Schistocerca serialis cubense]
MDGIVEYLKSPSLVAKIQLYFGVFPKKVLYDKCELNGLTKSLNTLQSKSACNIHNRVGNQCSGVVSNGRSDSEGLIGTESKQDCPETDVDDETVSSESETEASDYVVTKLFWHYLFIVGTALGDEIFYASFIPFWFWNIDGAVGRRVVLVWAIIMYIGQSIKDVVRWPRPSYPAIRLQKKWAQEYGMPSTHAMVGVSIPFSVILYTMNRYQYSVSLGLIVAVVWCTVICVSRLYLGMHSVLDIVVGLMLAIALMFPVVPIVDTLDHHLLTNKWSPGFVMLVSILVMVFYPSSDRWTPTRGDTTIVVSVSTGILIGAWLNYQLGNLYESSLSPPYTIIWPSYEMLGLATLRTAIGFCCLIATRAVGKSASYATVCALLRLSSKEIRESQYSIENKQKIIVEISYKYITYFLMGINTAYLLPNVFRLIGIERPTFYTEI